MNPRRKKQSVDSPAFGDWRVAVEKPHESEHLAPLPLFSVKRMHLRAEYLQSAPTSQWIQEAAASAAWRPIRGWRRVLRLIIAYFGLLPLSLITVVSVLLQLHHAAPSFGQVSFWLSEPVWYTLLGSLLFCALKITRLIDPVMVFIYVVGHELTHALAVLCSFGRVQAVKFDLSGGYVETDSDNLFIALSPYFVPLWMLLWMGALWLVNTFYPFAEAPAWFHAGFGFWWCFHLFWTCWVIPREQPDMLENGFLFSMLIIIVTNIAVLLAVLCCFGAISPAGFMADFQACAQESWAMLVDVVRALSALM